MHSPRENFSPLKTLAETTPPALPILTELHQRENSYCYPLFTCRRHFNPPGISSEKYSFPKMPVLTLYSPFPPPVPGRLSLCFPIPRPHPVGLVLAPPASRPYPNLQPTPKSFGSLPEPPGIPTRPTTSTTNRAQHPMTSTTNNSIVCTIPLQEGAALYRAAPSPFPHFLTASLPLAGAVSSISQEHLIASPSNTTPFTAPRSRRALILSAQKVCLPNREEITLKNYRPPSCTRCTSGSPPLMGQ